MLQQLRSRDEGVGTYALAGNANGPAVRNHAHIGWPSRLQDDPSIGALPTEMSAWAQLPILSAARTAGLRWLVGHIRPWCTVVHPNGVCAWQTHEC